MDHPISFIGALAGPDAVRLAFARAGQAFSSESRRLPSLRAAGLFPSLPVYANAPCWSPGSGWFGLLLFVRSSGASRPPPSSFPRFVPMSEDAVVAAGTLGVGPLALIGLVAQRYDRAARDGVLVVLAGALAALPLDPHVASQQRLPDGSRLQCPALYLHVVHGCMALGAAGMGPCRRFICSRSAFRRGAPVSPSRSQSGARPAVDLRLRHPRYRSCPPANPRFATGGVPSLPRCVRAGAVLLSCYDVRPEVYHRSSAALERRRARAVGRTPVAVQWAAYRDAELPRRFHRDAFIIVRPSRHISASHGLRTARYR